MPTRTKTFDAVEMSRRLREQTGRKLAAMTRAQRLALLNAHIRPSSAGPATGGHAQPARESPVLREEPPPPA